MACALAAPVLFLIGQALLPSLPDTLPAAFDGMLTHRDQLIASRLFTTAGAFLFVPAAAVILHLVPAGTRGSRVLTVGSVLFGIGTFFNGLSQAVAGYATQAATSPEVTQEAGLAVMGQLGAGAVGLPIAFWSIPLFALGLLTMGVGLIRARAVPLWQPILLIVGTLLAAALAGMGPIVALTQAPFTAGFLALAITAWRQGYVRTNGQGGRARSML